MSKKNRSIEDYRAAGYRFPRIAKTFNSPALYAGAVAVSVAAFAVGVTITSENVKDISSPLKTVSNYQSIAAKNSSAYTWTRNFISTAPPSEKTWNVSAIKEPQQPVDFKTCANLGMLPSTLVASSSADGANFSTTAQAYGAGQAMASFKSYVKKFSTCWNVTESVVRSDDHSFIVAKYGAGFFFTVGDAIVFVDSNNNTLSNADSLLNFYMKCAAETLKLSQCHTFSEDVSDKNRSIYYNPKSYTGWIISDTVSSTVNTNNIPTPVYGNILDEPNMSEPEAPLPANFPKLPQPKPVQPTISNYSSGNAPDTSARVSYQVSDANGPGCGWAWSGQQPPVENTQQILQKKQKTISDSLNQLNSSVYSFVSGELQNASSSLNTMQQISDWNSYINSVSGVYAKWSWLNAQRDNLYPLWETYVANHDNWLSFDDRKNTALTQYNKEVDSCNAANKQVSDWDTQWSALYQQQQQQNNAPAPSASSTSSPSSPSSSPSSSSSDTTSPSDSVTVNTGTPTSSSVSIPPRPQGCTVAPTKPAILSESKPSEPQMPNIPQGVTIPNSWEQPKKQ